MTLRRKRLYSFRTKRRLASHACGWRRVAPVAAVAAACCSRARRRSARMRRASTSRTGRARSTGCASRERRHVHVREGDGGQDAHRHHVSAEPGRRRGRRHARSARTTSHVRPAAATQRSPRDAISQADHFVDVAQPAAGDLPPVLDLETTGGLKAARSAHVDAELADGGARAYRRARARLHVAQLLEDRARATRQRSQRPASRSGSRTGRARRRRSCRRRAGRTAAGRSGSGRAIRASPASRLQVDADRFHGATVASDVIPRYPTGAPAAAHRRRSSAPRSPASA